MKKSPASVCSRMFLKVQVLKAWPGVGEGLTKIKCYLGADLVWWNHFRFFKVSKETGYKDSFS